MKRPLGVGLMILCGAFAIATSAFAAPTTPAHEPKVERAEFSDLPYNHWAYPCVSKLRELFRIPAPPYVEPNLWTRYEFAVFCARLNDKNPDLSDPTARDILYTLNQEFAVEIRILTARIDENPFEARVTAPPKLTIAPSVLARTGYKSYIAKDSEKKTEAFQSEAGLTK